MLKIVTVTEEGEALDTIRQLFREYETGLNENICFQSFEKELQNPLQKYGSPKGYLAMAVWNEEVAGCIAFMPLGEGVCEMKRLYVRPAFRKHGIGRALSAHLIQKAREAGYRIMRLDTLPKLQAAVQLYRTLGFTDCEAYYHNPLEGVIYMEKKLTD